MLQEAHADELKAIESKRLGDSPTYIDFVTSTHNEIPLRDADYKERILAFCLDLGILYILFKGTGFIVLPYMVAASILLTVGYFYYHSTSPGKWILSLVIIDSTGKKAPIYKMIFRDWLKIFFSLFFGTTWFYKLWTNSWLHDSLLGTKVVYSNIGLHSFFRRKFRNKSYGILIEENAADSVFAPPVVMKEGNIFRSQF